jgi:hypothetical protein
MGGKGASSRGSRQPADVKAILTVTEVLDRALSDLGADLPIVVDPDGDVVGSADFGEPLDELAASDVKVVRAQLVLQRSVIFDHCVVLPVLPPPGGQGRCGSGAMRRTLARPLAQAIEHRVKVEQIPDLADQHPVGFARDHSRD